MHCYTCGQRIYGQQTVEWLSQYQMTELPETLNAETEAVKHLTQIRNTAVVASTLCKSLGHDLRHIPHSPTYKTEREQIEQLLSRTKGAIALFIGNSTPERVKWAEQFLPLFIEKFPTRVENLRLRVAALKLSEPKAFVAIGTSVDARDRYTTAAIAKYKEDHPTKTSPEIAREMGLSLGKVSTTLGNITRMKQRALVAQTAPVVQIPIPDTTRSETYQFRARWAIKPHVTTQQPAIDPSIIQDITASGIRSLRQFYRVA